MYRTGRPVRSRRCPRLPYRRLGLCPSGAASAQPDSGVSLTLCEASHAVAQLVVESSHRELLHLVSRLVTHVMIRNESLYRSLNAQVKFRGGFTDRSTARIRCPLRAPTTAGDEDWKNKGSRSKQPFRSYRHTLCRLVTFECKTIRGMASLNSNGAFSTINRRGCLFEA